MLVRAPALGRQLGEGGMEWNGRDETREGEACDTGGGWEKAGEHGELKQNAAATASQGSPSRPPLLKEKELSAS